MTGVEIYLLIAGICFLGTLPVVWKLGTRREYGWILFIWLVCLLWIFWAALLMFIPPSDRQKRKIRESEELRRDGY